MFRRSLEYYANRFHPKQVKAWQAYKERKNIVLPWGRRTGKDNFFCEVAVEHVEEKREPVLYVAKTQKQARRIIWPKLRKILKGQPDWHLKESSLEAYHRPSETSIAVGGADLSEDNLVGVGYGLIICSEFALWRKPEIVKLQLAPMLADYAGQIMYGSTKRGKNHFYDLHQMATANPGEYFVDEATIEDNSFIDPRGKKIVLDQYTGTDDPLFRQEILNEYVTFQGMVFALAEEDYSEKIWDAADLDHSYHVRGVDHGFSPDPTACVWIAYNHRKGYWQVYSEYKQTALLIHQHAEIIQKLEPYRMNETISDIDPQLIAEYDAIGLSMTPAGKYDKQSRLLRIVNALKLGKLRISVNCRQLLKEMASYEWDQDGNDHLIDALIYAYTNATQPELAAEEPEKFADNRMNIHKRHEAIIDQQEFD